MYCFIGYHGYDCLNDYNDCKLDVMEDITAVMPNMTIIALINIPCMDMVIMAAAAIADIIATLAVMNTFL